MTRSHPDFAALWLARTWLGEHRASTSHLYQRIREIRGMNYGDYAYIEAFPRGMFQFFPDPNIARRAQIFEIWIRPVVPENAAHGAPDRDPRARQARARTVSPRRTSKRTRDYLMKNVFVMTATQNQQLGYALDSKWYGMGEFTATMRDRLSKLTREDVNARDPSAPVGQGPADRHHHEGRGRPARQAALGCPFADQVRRRQARGAPRGGQGHRGAQARDLAGRRDDHARRKGLRGLKRTPPGSPRIKSRARRRPGRLRA